MTEHYRLKIVIKEISHKIFEIIIKTMKDEKDHLTSNSGSPVYDNENVKTAGEHGPTVMENVWYLEKLGNFDRERIPERVVHAKGSGAFGEFKVTNDITRFTSASIFSEVGKETPVLARF